MTEDLQQDKAIALLLRIHEAVEEGKGTFSPGLEWFRFLIKFRDVVAMDADRFIKGSSALGRLARPKSIHIMTKETLHQLGVDPKKVESRPAQPTRDNDSWTIYCKEMLHTTHLKFGDVVESYINEAEHQDGYGYWENFTPWTFDGVKNLMEDFALYLDNYV